MKTLIKIKEFLEEEGVVLKHLPGQHPQKRHGNRGVSGSFAEFVPGEKWVEGGRKYRKDSMSKEYFEKKYPNRKLPPIKPEGGIINTHVLVSIGKRIIGGEQKVGYEMVSGPFRVIPEKNGKFTIMSLGKETDDNYLFAKNIPYNSDGYFSID